MRNFRKAALAGATAVALAFSTANVALADTADTQKSSFSSEATKGETEPAIGGDGRKTEGNGGSSTRIGKALGAYDEKDLNGIDGRALFGSSKTSHEGGDFSSQPLIGQALYAVSVLLGITAIATLVAAPAYNFLVHNQF